MFRIKADAFFPFSGRSAPFLSAVAKDFSASNLPRRHVFLRFRFDFS